MAPVYDIVEHINDYLPRIGKINTPFQIPGFFAFAKFYEKMVNEAKDGDVFLEVGSFLGRSTAFMANEIKKSGKKIQFYSVDPWTTDFYDDKKVKDAIDKHLPKNAPFENDYSGEVKKAIVELGLEHYVKLIQTITKTFKNALMVDHEDHAKFDFIFIDGSHEYKDVLDDIKTLYPLLKKGGIMAGDDYKYGDVKRAVEEVFGNNYILSEGYTWSSWIHRKE